MTENTEKRDITRDLLLCNRCGGCRAVCPIYDVYREEWSAARGKVELAEAFFRGEQLDEKKIREVFDLCLHCMTCEENCPSGMRADEIVLAVRAEMAKRGLIPGMKKAALGMIRKMDAGIFKVMRSLGMTRKERLHGYGEKNPFGFLFPLIGWSSERVFPLPRSKPFLGNNPEFFPAERLEGLLATPGRPGDILPDKQQAQGPSKGNVLLKKVLNARHKNLEKGLKVYFYIGHTVNHFFPEEAESAVWLLNLLGADVEVPADQECCGAPFFYAGDIESAREAAADAISRFEGHDYDYIVTTCSSGGLMLKKEYPRLFDMNADGFFQVEWDEDSEVFVRGGDTGEVAKRYKAAVETYQGRIAGKVMDIHEILAEMLELEEPPAGGADLFSREMDRGARSGLREGAGGAGKNIREGDATEGEVAGSGIEAASLAGRGEAPGLPVVTYHHPCHLNRGQGVNWQPEGVLELLPGYRYVKMEEADRCCGGGGFFTFAHPDASEKVGSLKMDAVEALAPDIVATACPLCRIQLMDLVRRRYITGSGERKNGDADRSNISVTTPAELLASELRRIIDQN